MIKKFSVKSFEKRKEDRKNFPEFFRKHINFIKKNKIRCMECDCILIGDVSEVAHILEKQTFKSVATLDDNILYLCGWKNNNNCHGKFDNSSIDIIKNMKIFNTAKKRVTEMEDLLTEKLNYKFYDKWDL